MGLIQEFCKYDVTTTRETRLPVILTYHGQNHSEMLTFFQPRIRVLAGSNLAQKLLHLCSRLAKTIDPTS